MFLMSTAAVHHKDVGNDADIPSFQDYIMKEQPRKKGDMQQQKKHITS
jgi:hypothetical protein